MTEYNAMICLSVHQTMAFKDPGMIAKATFIEIGVYVLGRQGVNMIINTN